MTATSPYATILVTGGAGFIGSNFIHYYLEKYASKIINLDALTYAGNLENLAEVETNPNCIFHKANICDGETVRQLFQKHNVEAVINFAAESHVDRSIHSAAEFLQTNVIGTQVLLDAARESACKRFIQISTDEVYGSLGPTGKFSETTPLAPNSPYSASKAAADLLARSYFETYRFPVIITRCSNNYGPYQFPEKLIPLMITNALEDRELPVYGDGQNVRDWIAVRDHCRAIDLVLHHGAEGQVYNIGGNCEKPNLEIVRAILKILGRSERLITFVKDRPGHDRRYAMDYTKIRTELGWKPQETFDAYLTETVNWYIHNETWWRKIKSGDYLHYYDRQYHKE